MNPFCEIAMEEAVRLKVREVVLGGGARPSTAAAECAFLGRAPLSALGTREERCWSGVEGKRGSEQEGM
jgi:hypothetical protein